MISTPTDRGRGYDLVALLALTLGFFVVPVAGRIAGVAMVWAGPRWGRFEAVLATLLWPVAIGVPMLLATTLPGRVADIAGLLGLLVVLTCWLPYVIVRLIRTSSLTTRPN